MAPLCPIHRNYYAIAVIAIIFLHPVDYSVIATTNIKKNNAGFSAHLIRANHPDLPLHKHKDNKVSPQLKGPDEPEAELEMTVRTDKKSSLHIMKLSVGTPPTDVYVYFDTGSDLFWTQCQPCLDCYKSNYPLFDPRKSSTYRNLSCGAEECRYFENITKPSIYPGNPADYCKEDPKRTCVYRNSYADQAYSEGFLAKESITMTTTTGEVVAFEDIAVGCGIKNGVGKTDPSGNEMGVIGFGTGSLSFVTQIAPQVGGKKLSYCLVPRNADPKSLSKIYFGKGSEVEGEGVVSTPLVDEFTYSVRTEGMTIGDEFVSFNLSNGKSLKMIIDSGSPVTVLPKEIFNKVIPLLKKMIDPKYEPAVISEKKDNVSHFCLNTKTFPEEIKVTLHFEGGGDLQLAPESLFYREREVGYKVCSTIIVAEELPIGIFGGPFQGNMLVGLDMDKKLASFKPTNCLN